MKIVVFVVLLVVVPFLAEAGSCAGKTVEVWVANGIGMTGDGLARPDPYVKVQIGGRVQRTRVIRGNRNPGWWQRFKFYSPNSNFMKIEVWEKDSGFRGGDDHLGTCMEQLQTYGSRYTHVQCTVVNDGVVKLFYRCY